MGETAVKNGEGSCIQQIDVLWITAGLGCEGETIAMTAAMQHRIEDVLLGGIPWIPKVNFHNPFLAGAVRWYRR
jgi:hydrogenase small subunit